MLWVAAGSYWIYTSFEYAFRVVLLETIVVVPVAISILFSGLCYKPKRFTWIWKIVPFILLSTYMFDWYVGWGTPSPPERPLLYTILDDLVGSALIFPAFYLPFSFAYSKTLPPAKISPKLLLISLAMAAFESFNAYIPYPHYDIDVKVNYVAEYNKITRPANYDPNQNAAPYYQKAFETLVDIPEDIQAIRKIWPADMNEVELNSLKNWLALNKELIPDLRAAAQKPYYWLQREAEDNFLLTMEMPDLRKFRMAVYLLSFEAKLMAVQGQTRPALQNVIDMYKMGNHLSGSQVLVQQLVAFAFKEFAAKTAFQIMDRAKVSPDLLQDFQNRFQVLAANQTYIIDFTAEKIMVYDIIQRMFTDGGKGGGHVYGTRASEDTDHLESLWGWEVTPERKERLKKLKRHQTTELADELYDYFSQAATKTPWQLHQQRLDLNKVAAEKAKDNPLLNMLMPDTARAIQASFYRKAHVDALIATIAILRYKADKIELPDSLEQLISSGYLKELPMDPYSEAPLLYKRLDDNFTLYSLGADFDDDGGTPSKWGEGEEGGDQVFWPVERY